jgi:PIN domain
MPISDTLLFIDTNKYLDLYRRDNIKNLLAILNEQVNNIFVTQQIVDEVHRNKLTVAANFLREKQNKFTPVQVIASDLLAPLDSEEGNQFQTKLKNILKEYALIKVDFDNLANNLLSKIQLSSDEVSIVLSPIFANAKKHTSKEMQKAKDRKELGNPPGKKNDPIGDQLNWEQILTQFEGKKHLVIISSDCDFGTEYNKIFYLNQYLRDELCKVATNPDVYIHDSIKDGIKKYIEITNLNSEIRLTPEEAEAIENEERSLQSESDLSGGIQHSIAELLKNLQPSLHNNPSRLLEGLSKNVQSSVGQYPRSPILESIEKKLRESAISLPIESPHDSKK